MNQVASLQSYGLMVEPECLARKSYFPDHNSNLFLNTRSVKLCIAKPITGMTNYGCDDKDRVNYFPISIGGPISSGNGPAIPENCGIDRLKKIIGALNLCLCPMRGDVPSHLPVLYIMAPTTACGSQGIDPFEAAVRDLLEIRRLTNRHVWVICPSMEFTSPNGDASKGCEDYCSASKTA